MSSSPLQETPTAPSFPLATTHGSPGWAAAHRAVTASHPLLQHRLRVSLIVSEEEFSTISVLFALPLHTSAQTCLFLLFLHAQGPVLLAGQGSDPCGGRMQGWAGWMPWLRILHVPMNIFTNIVGSNSARSSQENSAGVGFG